MEKRIVGFLPEDWPGSGAAISLGIQHFLAMFPATVLVPILTGFNVSATLFASGVATLAALAVTRLRIPLYYGSSFSAIAAVSVVVANNGGGVEGVRVAQVGILAAAIVQIIVGFLIMRAGHEALYRWLPPVVTGPVAMIIAFALAGVAIDMASGMCCGLDSPSGAWWTVATVTLVATVLWSWRLKGRGLVGMLPILGGAAIGYLVAIPFGLVDIGGLTSAQVVRPPALTFPNFAHPAAIAAVLTIVPVVLATIPESVAHLLQIGEAVNKIARDLGRPEIDFDRLVGLNLIADGTGDMGTGSLGGSMGTNYGENIAVVVITGAATTFALVAAALLAIAASLSGHLEVVVRSVPTAVTGGLALYLFGAFGVVGIKMLQRVPDLLEPRNLAVISLILILGIGGGNKYGGSLPIPLPPGLDALLPGGVPAIAAAALVGILLNFIFNQFPTREERAAAIAAASDPE